MEIEWKKTVPEKVRALILNTLMRMRLPMTRPEWLAHRLQQIYLEGFYAGSKRKRPGPKQ